MSETAALVREGKLVQLIIFRLSDEEFGIPIEEVREIIRSSAVTPVPGAPDFIEGMINVRGEIATVVDLRALFSLRAEAEAPKHIVITAQGKNLFAFEVDEVTEVLRVAAVEVKSTPELAARIDAGRVTDYVTGFVTRGGRLIVVLDLARVLSEKELSQATGRPNDPRAAGGPGQVP